MLVQPASGERTSTVPVVAADLEFERRSAVLVAQAVQTGEVRRKIGQMLVALLCLYQHQRGHLCHLAVHQFLDFAPGLPVAERTGQNHDDDGGKSTPA